MQLRKLPGHSGCQVYLFQKDDSVVVRKASSSVSYNERLAKQIEKQDSFKSHLVSKPLVLDSGKLNDLCWFDMEFVRGPTLANYILQGDQEGAYRSFKVVMDFIGHNRYLDENIEEFVYNKIHMMSLSKEYQYYSDYCLDFDWSSVRKSYCHGDLTFENIIKSGDNLYLIDFLDSFCNSRVIDYSKLLQDILLSWSWRKENRKPFIKLIVMYEYFLSTLTELEIEASKRMLVLNLLRVLPYCKIDSDSYDFVEDNLKFLKSEFC